MDHLEFFLIFLMLFNGIRTHKYIHMEYPISLFKCENIKININKFRYRIAICTLSVALYSDFLWPKKSL